MLMQPDSQRYNLCGVLNMDMCAVSTCNVGDTRNREMPLRFNWLIDPKSIDALDLPPPRNSTSEHVRVQLVCNALLAHYSELPGVHYPRRPAAFTGMGRYQGKAYSFRTVRGGVDELASLGLVDNWIAPRRTEGGVESVFRAGPDLLSLLPATSLCGIQYCPIELIRLRNADKRPIDYRDTEQTRLMRRNLAQINDGLRALRVSLPGTPGCLWQGPILRVEGVILNTTRVAL